MKLYRGVWGLITMRICSRLFLVIIVGVMLLPVRSHAAPCSSFIKDVFVRSTDATASTWANWRESDGSVARESRRMFEEAKQKAPELERPEAICPSQCVLSRWPSMIFSSTPRAYKTQYSEEKKCGGYLEQTSKVPLTYHVQLERGIEQLSEWIGEFSQGKGKLGRELYTKCDGSCSPQYRYLITVHPDFLSVDAHVVCGHARDKDDDMYTLSYRYRWSCEDRL